MLRAIYLDVLVTCTRSVGGRGLGVTVASKKAIRYKPKVGFCQKEPEVSGQQRRVAGLM